MDHPPLYGSSYGATSTTQLNPSQAEKITPTKQRKTQDTWAALLFFLNIAATVTLFVLYAPNYIKTIRADNNNQNANTTKHNDSKKLLYSIPLAAGVGMVMSCAYMFFMARFPATLIKFTLYMSIALYFVSAAVLLAYGSYIAGAITAVVAVLYTFCALSWRSRIPFATVMLKTIVSIVRTYPSTIFAGFCGLLLDVMFFVFWALTFAATINRYSGENDQGKQYGLSVYLLFSFYWTSEVIKNVVHVTVSGVFATYYFLAGTPAMVSSPTSAAAGRALGKSFGSICFGSLLVALIKTIRAICRQLRQSSGGDGAAAFIACIAECILGIIEGLVEYFNHYAYTQVAIYGKDYISAAKDTWRLIKSHGIDIIINDNLIGNVLVMGSLLVGVVTGGASYIFCRNAQEQGTALVAALIGFLVGTFINSVFTEVISSGISTTFVCLAEDPSALLRSKPELYQNIQAVYPGVLSRV